jgi:hypothetical protein
VIELADLLVRFVVRSRQTVGYIVYLDLVQLAFFWFFVVAAGCLARAIDTGAGY